MPDRERLYRTEGIVLRRNDFGEADRILVLVTPGLGKVRVLAKGVRKVPSRKAGHVEPFMRSQFLLARGRDLDIVTQAEVVDTYQGLRQDLLRTSYACYVAELVDAFAREGEESQALYRLLGATLSRLSAGHEPRLLTRFFELRLLACAGYHPELRRCVSCGSEHEPSNVFFSASDGGARCRRCGQGDSGAVELSLRGFKVLRYLQSQEYETVAGLQLRPETAREIELLLRRYLAYVLERNLKSVSFLQLLQAGG
jgi:DNA repair protein RecO (recombination protein O)